MLSWPGPVSAHCTAFDYADATGIGDEARYQVSVRRIENIARREKRLHQQHWFRASERPTCCSKAFSKIDNSPVSVREVNDNRRPAEEVSNEGDIDVELSGCGVGDLESGQPSFIETSSHWSTPSI
jgi:hypothetical protein